MLGWATLLRKKECTAEEIREGITVIERNCRAQAQLLDDALEMSRIISGQLRLERKACDLTSVIYAAIDVVRPAADAKGISLAAEINAHISSCYCDDMRIQQVVWNLLANAIKFTSKGGSVRVKLDREDSNVRIGVTDDGQGIDPDLLPYIFDRFRQGDFDIQRRHGGLGLGLSIVKHLVELHGGTVKAYSDGKGCGASFIVELPTSTNARSLAPSRHHFSDDGASASMRPPRSPVRLDGVRILVVDDEPEGRHLMAKAFSEAGASVRVTGSVREALAALGSAMPHILVSDLAMPDEDGFDLIRQIRNAGYTAQRLPAVALTAFATKTDVVSALSRGFQIHVSKPVNAEHLISVVARLANVAIQV